MAQYALFFVQFFVTTALFFSAFFVILQPQKTILMIDNNLDSDLQYEYRIVTAIATIEI